MREETQVALTAARAAALFLEAGATMDAGVGVSKSKFARALATVTAGCPLAGSGLIEGALTGDETSCCEDNSSLDGM